MIFLVSEHDRQKDGNDLFHGILSFLIFTNICFFGKCAQYIGIFIHCQWLFIQ